ncbi:MAG: AAA family ATPase [Chloroflexi bacterium]|nr:AAA family ATPase [Chloroflexota bacterium]
MLRDIKAALNSLRYVPALRGLLHPSYELGSDRVAEVSLQQGLDASEEQLATNLGYARPLEDWLSGLLEKVTGTGLRVEIVPGQMVEVKSKTQSGPVNIVTEGFGTNSLIMLFHQLLSAAKGATVLIEEPEIHLHPKAQAELAEVMADTAKAEDKQVIMTTHSEHLVERLLLLVAEGILTPDDLAIYSFAKDEKSECSSSEIKVTENGQVEGGLTDFYANNLDTLDRRVKALRRSQ